MPTRRIVRVAVLALLVVVLLDASLLVGAASARSASGLQASAGASGPHLVAVYPNPTAPEDAGEFVTVAFPPGTTGETCTLDDGESRVRLPSPSAPGRVTYSAAANRTRRLVGGPVVEATLPRLANAGERLRLRCDGESVDVVSYRNAPEGERYRNGTWRPLGLTAFTVRSVRNANATLFALPDDPGVPLAALRGARERILLGAYTFTSERVARVLRRAAARGVRVHVLVEGGPVGGVSAREAKVLDGLVAANVTVTVLDGPHARYPFHHAKYAVVDGRVLVTSENWKPGGVGGHLTRGWGAVVRDPTLADDLASVFRADTGWIDGVPWRTYRANATFQPPNPAAETYPSAFAPLDARTGRVSLVVSPDDSRRALVGFVRNATRSLDVEQVAIGNDTVLLNATVAAAERGVRVRVLLSGAWYVRRKNRALARRLNARARREGLDLRAKLADPRGRFGHVHVKGAVADERRVLVGSVNWDRNAVRNNREVELVVASPAVGRYYGRLFRADWRGGRWTLPLPLAGAVVLVVAGVGWYLRRTVAFETGAVGWRPAAAGPGER